MNFQFDRILVLMSIFIFSTCKQVSENIIPEKTMNKVNLERKVNLFLESAEFSKFHSALFTVSYKLKELEGFKPAYLSLSSKDFLKTQKGIQSTATTDSLAQNLITETQNLLQIANETLPDFSTYEVTYSMQRKMYETILEDALKSRWSELQSETDAQITKLSSTENIDCMEINSQNSADHVITLVSDLFLKKNEKDIVNSLVNSLILEQIRFLSCQQRNQL